ncbi:peptidoglycan editing factor PgeF [Candidatus Dependentiae bacterium]|nr:MAG: peptidoglycan editing factor PgeF [Candidatus Dependentiae bacterium]
MIAYQNVHIFFGTEQDNINKNTYPLNGQQSFTSIADRLMVDNLYYVNQVHSTKGVIVDKNTKQNALTSVDADFLITDNICTALAVFTADCTPVMLYDPVVSVIAAVHAGWKGLAADVIQHALFALQKNYDVQLNNIQAFIGPSAKSCCYEIQNNVYDIFKNMERVEICSFVSQKEGKFFLDLPACAKQQLIVGGISLGNINRQFAGCTICNKKYCSYRREQNSLRNVNVIVMR